MLTKINSSQTGTQSLRLKKQSRIESVIQLRNHHLKECTNNNEENRTAKWIMLKDQPEIYCFTQFGLELSAQSTKTLSKSLWQTESLSLLCLHENVKMPVEKFKTINLDGFTEMQKLILQLVFCQLNQQRTLLTMTKDQFKQIFDAGLDKHQFLDRFPMMKYPILADHPEMIKLIGHASHEVRERFTFWNNFDHIISDDELRKYSIKDLVTKYMESANQLIFANRNSDLYKSRMREYKESLTKVESTLENREIRLNIDLRQLEPKLELFNLHLLNCSYSCDEFDKIKYDTNEHHPEHIKDLDFYPIQKIIINLVLSCYKKNSETNKYELELSVPRFRAIWYTGYTKREFLGKFPYLDHPIRANDPDAIVLKKTSDDFARKRFNDWNRFGGSSLTKRSLKRRLKA